MNNGYKSDEVWVWSEKSSGVPRTEKIIICWLGVTQELMVRSESHNSISHDF